MECDETCKWRRETMPHKRKYIELYIRKQLLLWSDVEGDVGGVHNKL